MARAFLSGTFLIFLLLLTSTGCSDQPVIPDNQPVQNPAVSGFDGTRTHECLGYSALIIDTETGGVDVLPWRSTEWHFNLTGILNTTMGVGAVVDSLGTDLANGLITLDITLTHPFATKPQLSGFDVKGILITPGTLTMGPGVFADADETSLDNADGYIRWWNPTEFTTPGMFGYVDGLLASHPGSALTATVNPYKLFADVLEPMDGIVYVSAEPLDSPEGRAVFTAGSANTRQYIIQFPLPGPQVVYGYAIDCSWDTPSPNPPVDVPQDFPMGANQPEAFRVVLQASADTLYYDTESGVGGGVLRFQINVHDWQGQSAGDIQSEIDSVEIYAPDLFAGPVAALFLNETADKARYSVDLTGTAVPSAVGEIKAACRVVSSGGSTYQQTGAPAPTDTIASWQTITLDVTNPDCAGDANNDFGEAVTIGLDESVEGLVCLPDDYRDYFTFSIPPVYATSGSIDFYCDAEPTTIGIYKMNEELVYEESVSGGLASITMDEVMLYPRDYYLRIFTSNDTQVSPYLLEMNIDLVDVTPDSPVEITPDDFYVQPSRCYFNGNTLITIGYRGLWTWDITDPTEPVLLYHDYEYYSNKFACQWPYIYYADYISSPEVYHVSLIDFTDPANPVFHESVIENDDLVKYLTINSEHLYMIYEIANVRTVGIWEWASDPTSPSPVWSSDVPDCDSFHAGLALVNPETDFTRMLVWSESTLELWDVETPDTAVTWLDTNAGYHGNINDIISNYSFFYIVHGDGSEARFTISQATGMDVILDRGFDTIPLGPLSVTFSGDYAYVGTDNALATVNISDPDTPSFDSSVPVDPYAYHVNVGGDLLSLVPIYTGFELYSISYPALPDLIYKSPVINNAKEIELFDNYALVADDDYNVYHTLKTVDISDPSNPEIVEVFPVGNSILYMKYIDGTLFAVVGWDLVIIDCSDPLDLSVHDTIDLADMIGYCDIYEDTLYLITGNSHLYVYDATDPTAPVYVTTKNTDGNGRGLTINGDYMYVPTSNNIIEIFSISNPLNPTSQGSYTPGEEPGWVMSQDDYLYVCAENTFEILDISNPTAPVYLGSVLGYTYDDFKYSSTDGLFAYLGGGHLYHCTPMICSLWPPDSPSVVYDFSTYEYGSPYNMEVSNGILYVASSKGMRIYDLY